MMTPRFIKSPPIESVGYTPIQRIELGNGIFIDDVRAHPQYCTEPITDTAILLYVPSNVVRIEPIILHRILDNIHMIDRVIMVVEPHASLTVCVEYAGKASVRTAYQLLCAQGSEVNFVNSIGDMQFVHLSYDVVLQGAHARVSVRGVYAPQGNQQVVIQTHQHHQAPNTESEVLFKGILRDAAQAEYKGMILVDPGANGTNASQQNKNILLSDAARVWSVPGLEVLANDVQCAHGSAIGQVNADHMIYMQSRGLSELSARTLLIKGFVADVFEGVRNEADIFSKSAKLLHYEEYSS